MVHTESLSANTKPLIKQIWMARGAYLFLLPSMGFLFLFLYYPVLSAILHSFTEWDGFNVARFTGIDNYIQLLKDPNMFMAIKNMFFFSFAHLLCDLVTSVGVALLIHELGAGNRSRFFQSIFIIPIMIPGIITMFIWKFIYDPQFGLGNSMLNALGLPTQLFLADPDFAMFWLVFLGFPWVWGPGVLMELAGLQGISDSVYDSALIEGAPWFRRIWSIDIPIIAPQIRVLAMLSLINSLQSFLYQLVLTAGGPGNSTYVPGYMIYQQGVKYSRMGYACAIGVVLLLIILSISQVVQKIGPEASEKIS